MLISSGVDTFPGVAEDDKKSASAACSSKWVELIPTKFEHDETSCESSKNDFSEENVHQKITSNFQIWRIKRPRISPTKSQSSFKWFLPPPPLFVLRRFRLCFFWRWKITEKWSCYALEAPREEIRYSFLQLGNWDDSSRIRTTYLRHKRPLSVLSKCFTFVAFDFLFSSRRSYSLSKLKPWFFI